MTIVPVDIHTHNLLQIPGTAIVNYYPEEFTPQEGGWYSVGIHPWRVHSSFEDSMQAGRLAIQNEAERMFSRELVAHPQVLAIGEAGLDKLIDTPVHVQIKVFEYQARLADEIGKPLIIHLVRAVDELLKLKQTLRPSVPWIIHGFRGKPALAQEFLRHGFYLSFGEKYQADALRTIPSGRLFLETDESRITITELYQCAAKVRGISLEQLEETIRENIGKVFFKR